MPVRFDARVCRDLERSMELEWICTNGRGGYASGTVAGPNTRKYHGHLVVAAHPPIDRFVVLARVEDRLLVPQGVNGQSTQKAIELSTAEFADIVHPLGYQHISHFEMREGSPVWRYEVGELVVEKSLTLLHGQDTLILKYEIISAGGLGANGGAIKLQLQPLMAGRDFHSTIQLHQRPWWSVSQESNGSLQVSAPECPVRLAFTHNADRFNIHACWWYNFKFRVETSRGYPDREDLWTPGLLEFTLAPGKPAYFVAGTSAVEIAGVPALLEAERNRRRSVIADVTKAKPGDELMADLAAAADQFIAVRAGVEGTTRRHTVIAGYPWFEDWGRDTFIALCGLTLVTKRFEIAKSILSVFADHMKNGLLPNRFPDKAYRPDYNTVDASMWFIHAAYQYWRYSGDAAFLTKYLYSKLCEIIDCYQKGTDFGIHADVDGLILQGGAGTGHNLTWMDAKIGDWVVTPRNGKPVEINALWYSNLRIMAVIAKQAGDGARASVFEAMAVRVHNVFQKLFWNAEKGCLHDVVSEEGVGDGLVRPNQCIAVSVPFSPLDAEAQRAVMEVVERELMTPLGPRTLAPGSMGYQARCVGDQRARDMAYHQGTVWPWLVGPFVTGWVKTHGGKGHEAMKFIEPFRGHLREAGLGSISEIADGAAPHTPRGTPAQAWSVAEVLRAYCEDVLALAPAWPHEKVR